MHKLTFLVVLLSCLSVIHSQQLLQLGTVVTGSLGPNTQLTAQYIFTAPQVSISEYLFFALTSVSGDSDLAIYEQGSTVPLFNSTTIGSDIIKIPAGGLTSNRQYSVIVTASYGASNYSLFAYPASSTGFISFTLLTQLGFPLIAQSPQGGMAFFTYTTDPTLTSPLSISVDSFSGDADIYVKQGRAPTLSDYDYRSSAIASDTLTFNPTNGTLYYIGIYAYGAADAAYMITLSTPDTNINLVDGIGTTFSVRAGTYRYFSFQPVFPQEVVRITLQNLVLGDADMFVSVASVNPQPISGNSTWQATAWGDDSIEIGPSDPNYVPYGVYVIGVRGFTAATFKISVGSYNATTTLFGGQPQYVELHYKNDYQNFRVYNVDPSYFLAITADKSVGNVTIYVSGTTNPTRTKYDYISTDFAGRSQVFITHAKTGYYFIAVYSETDFANVTLTATFSQNAQLLTAGLYTGNQYVAGNGYRYYYFFVAPQAYNITILLNPSSGDPDMFISTTTSRPSTTNYMWKATKGGSNLDSIYITTSDQPAGNFTYYVGVYGYSSSTFRISYFLSGQTTTIYDRVPSSGVISARQYNYYMYYNNNPGATITIQLVITSRNTDADIYESTLVQNPSSSNYEHSATAYGSDTLAIPNAAAGYHYIGILGISDNTAYMITVFAGTQGQPLYDSIPIKNWVNPGDNNPYLYHNLWTNETINFALTILSGDADLTVILPNGQIRNSTVSGSDFISVNPSDYGAAAGNIEVMVSGYSTSEYVLTASRNWDNVYLISGFPQYGSVPSGKSQYFRFTNTDPTASVTVSVSPIGNSDPDVYVSVFTPNPSASNYTWRSLYYGYDQIIIPPSNNVTYFIGVYGASYGTNNYVIYTGASSTIYRVAEGIPFINNANAGVYSNAQYVPPGRVTVSMDLVPLTPNADPDIYVGTTYPATSTNSFWRGINWGADHIDIFGNDTNYVNITTRSPFYIGIRAYSQMFYSLTIRSTSTAITPLNNGMPAVAVSGDVGSFTYYYFDSSDTGVDLWINAFATNGRVSLWISTHNSRPSDQSGKYDFTSQIFGNNAYFHQRPGATQSGRYYIGVRSDIAGTQFQLTANTNQTALTLREGYSSYGNVPQGLYRYFTFRVYDNTRDISITARPLGTGDPDLFVGVGYTPSIYNYNYTSNTYGTDSIVITADQQAPGISDYTIAVYGFMQSTFWISYYLSNSTVEIFPLVPVAGSVARGKYNYYRVYLQDATLLNINLQVFSGDADIFESSQNHKPNSNDYEHASVAWGSDYLTFQASNGDHYIGIYGASASSYLLSVNPGSGNIITDGSSAFGFAMNGTYVTYLFHPVRTQAQSGLLGGTYASFYASISLVSGATTLLANPSLTSPTFENAAYIVQNWPGNILIPRPEDLNATAWTFAVYSHMNSTYYFSVQSDTAFLNPSEPRLLTSDPTTTPTKALLRRTSPGKYYVNIKILSGHANFYFCTWCNGATKDNANFTISADSLVAQSFFPLPDSFNSNGNIDAIWVGSDPVGGGAAVYSITIGDLTNYIRLTQDLPQQMVTSKGQSTFFRVFAGDVFQSSNLVIDVDVCGASSVPALYASFSNPYPNAQNNTYTGTLTPFSTAIAGTVPSSTDIYVGVEAPADADVSYSIYANVEQDFRPIPGGNITYSTDADTGYTVLQIPYATQNSISTVFTSTMELYVYKMQIYAAESLAKNMYTPCGVQTNGQLDGKTRQHIVHPKNATAEYMISLDRTVTWLVNVVAKNGAGLTQAYFPVLIEANSSGISGGVVFILILIILVCLYFIIGILYKAFAKGERGLDVIPNIDFWRDLPSLIWEGGAFLFTCGKSSTSYSRVQGTQHTEQEIGSFEPLPSRGAAASSSGGYGTV